MLFSAACERNKEPILAVLRDWLPTDAQVLEIGSGSGQHASHFCRRIPGLLWQSSDPGEGLADLQEQINAATAGGLARGSRLPPAITLDVTRVHQWPRPGFDAVFTANTLHIMPAPAVPQLLAGAARVLGPGGLLLIYGPFHDGGTHTAASNAAFDSHLRSLDAAMGVRDAREVKDQGRGLGLEPLADLAMPANNRVLVFANRGPG
jgi:SAM-dependent methyltransferase